MVPRSGYASVVPIPLNPPANLNKNHSHLDGGRGKSAEWRLVQYPPSHTAQENKRDFIPPIFFIGFDVLIARPAIAGSGFINF